MATSVTAAPRVKGQTLKSLLMYAESQLTPAEFQELLASVPPEERGEITRILATSTYPMRLVNQLTVAAARIARRPLPEFARHAGRFSAAEGIRGVYRFFARIMTPESMLAKATSIWSTMNLAGKMTMEKDGPRSAIVRLSGYPEPEEVMCMRVTGWMEELFDLAGSKNAAVAHGRCSARGDAACEWRVAW